MYNTTMKPVESLDAFYERHRPQTLENVLWYTYDKKTLPLKLMHAIQQRVSFVFYSDYAGSGKHLILSLLSRITDTVFTYIDDSVTLNDFENMCKRKNILEFLNSEQERSPYFVIHELHVREKQSVFVKKALVSTWPCIYMYTGQKPSIAVPLKFHLRSLPNTVVSSYIRSICTQYAFPISKRACIRLSKKGQSNIRYVLSLVHHLLSTEQSCTTNTVHNVFNRSYLDSFRNMSDIHEVSKNKGTFSYEYRLHLALSHPITVHNDVFRQYIHETDCLQKIEQIADLFSFTDTLHVSDRYYYFVSMHLL